MKESPTAFGSSYSEQAGQPLAFFEKKLEVSANSWVFGAFDKEKLVGILRLVRDEIKKEKHKAAIYGMYVAPSARRKGVARQLLEKAFETARELKGIRRIRIGVVTSNKAAFALYEKMGFKEYGREEAALFHAGRYYAEALMVRKLR